MVQKLHEIEAHPEAVSRLSRSCPLNCWPRRHFGGVHAIPLAIDPCNLSPGISAPYSGCLSIVGSRLKRCVMVSPLGFEAVTGRRSHRRRMDCVTVPFCSTRKLSGNPLPFNLQRNRCLGFRGPPLSWTVRALSRPDVHVIVSARPQFQRGSAGYSNPAGMTNSMTTHCINHLSPRATAPS